MSRRTLVLSSREHTFLLPFLSQGVSLTLQGCSHSSHPYKQPLPNKLVKSSTGPRCRLFFQCYGGDLSFLGPS